MTHEKIYSNSYQLAYFFKKVSAKQEYQTIKVHIGSNIINLTNEGALNIIFYHYGGIKQANIPFDQRLLVAGKSILFKSQDEYNRIPWSYEYAEYKNDLYFYPDGSIEKGILAEDTSFKILDQEVIFFKDHPINFHSNGQVKSGIDLKEI